MLNLFQHPWRTRLRMREWRGSRPWMLHQVQDDVRTQWHFARAAIILPTMNRALPSLLALSFAAQLATPLAAQAPPGLSETDKRTGAQAHPQLLAEFGGAMTGKAADYVRGVTQRVAAQSGGGARPQDYTVTLLNSNVNNAFAIPGGYVYVTRQLLALMNDEAELAFVMGHEVGHVAARHGQKRQERSALSGLLAGIAGAVTGSDLVAQGAGAVAQLTTLGYSRDQERQADSIGLRYITNLGYDPLASGDMLTALGAQTRLEAQLQGQGGQEPSRWLSTHPNNAERVARILKEAQVMIPQAGARRIGRDALLDAIDGLPYDDDPAQGIVNGNRFRHAGLGLAIDAPPGWRLANSATAVQGSAPDGSRFSFTQCQNADLAACAAAVWQANGARPPQMQPGKVNGLDTLAASVSGSSNGQPVAASLTVYRFAPSAAYALFALAPQAAAANLPALAGGVRRLTPADSAGIRSRRIQVVTVAKGDSIASLSARMAYDDDRQARFITLNQLRPDLPLTPGARVKLVVWR